MDSLTQIVLGAAVGEAVLGKRIGNKALLYGAIGGTIPDLDVFLSFFVDTITSIELHRGFSHSLLFGVLMAPLLGWLVNKIERKENLGKKLWTQLFFWCLITHPILDAFTTWGTQLFWPIDVKLAFNSVFVIDPFYTLPFLISCIFLMFYKRESKRREQINKLGLILSTSYLFLGLILKFVAYQHIEQELKAQGIVYNAISTRPSPMNTILWNANIDTEDEYLITDYSFFDTKPLEFKRYPKNREASNFLEKYPNVQRLIDISEGWYIIEYKDNAWHFYDLRFGLIPRKDGSSFFTFSYRLSEEKGKIHATELPKTDRDAKFMMQTLWRRIQGN